jgi:hypothetical protein
MCSPCTRAERGQHIERRGKGNLSDPVSTKSGVCDVFASDNPHDMVIGVDDDEMAESHRPELTEREGSEKENETLEETDW